MADSKAKKWDIRYRNLNSADSEIVAVLKQNQHLLPKSGTALDYACGLGANACFLASIGFETTAWDLSLVAIQRLREDAVRKGLSLIAESRDLELYPPNERSFDVIVVARYLDRKTIPSLVCALRKGGILFYQTFTEEKSDTVGPSKHSFLLEKNELISLFKNLRVLSFKDEGLQGDNKKGLRNESWLVAKKEF